VTVRWTRRSRRLAEAQVRLAEARAVLNQALAERVYEEARSVVLDEQLNILLGGDEDKF
jgi:hypothetical protein